MPYFIGVDVGGTTSTISVGDERGTLVELSPQFETRSSDGPRATVHDISTEIHATLQNRNISFTDVSSVTLATPGPASIDGVLQGTPNLRGEVWKNCPIREMLQTELRQTATELEVRYLGDGQAAALGEFAIRRGKVNVPDSLKQRWGILRGAPQLDLNSLFMVAIGTGFGGGEVRDGRVVRGRQGRAGHAGHLMLPANAFRYEVDRQLKVGNAFNTAESAASLTSLTHQLAHRLKRDEWAAHPLHQVDGGDKERAKQLRELAAQGDPLACELFQDQAFALGMALLTIQYIGDFDCLVIGGGVCDLEDEIKSQYLKTTLSSFHEHALDGFRDFSNIEFSRCGDQASVIGAYFDAMQG